MFYFGFIHLHQLWTQWKSCRNLDTVFPCSDNPVFLICLGRSIESAAWLRRSPLAPSAFCTSLEGVDCPESSVVFQHTKHQRESSSMAPPTLPDCLHWLWSVEQIPGDRSWCPRSSEQLLSFGPEQGQRSVGRCSPCPDKFLEDLHWQVL